MMNKANIQRNIFILTAVIIALIGIYALRLAFVIDEGWTRFAFLDQIVSLGLLVIFYKNRKYLNLQTYALIIGAIFLVLHNVGTLGPYDWALFWFRYDKMLHLLGGFVLFFLFYEFFLHSFEHGRHTHTARTLVLAMLCAMGVGAFTEIIEYIVGYFYNNPGSGFFFYGIGDFGEWNDTIFDMVANFAGSLAALVITFWRNLVE